MYRFIFGAAGSGKTTYIYESLTKAALREPGRRFYLFVPEQNTLKAQQELIRTSERHGLLNLDVLSFQLLAYRVMDELSVKKPEVMDEVTKSLLLRRACQETAGELSVYQKKLSQKGFIAQLKSLLSEFYQYDVGREALRYAKEHAESPLLRAKLSDISLIFARFHEMFSEGMVPSEEILVFLSKHIHKSKIFSGATVIFDGYTGFTPIQLKLISHILSLAEDVQFAVTIPREAKPYQRGFGKTDVSELFWLSKETVFHISELGEKGGTKKGEDIFIEGEKKAPKVEVIAAADPTEEIRTLTRSIRKLAVLSGENNIRYRNMAVAVSDSSIYKEIIRREFERAEIPCFMDDKSESGGSAVVELCKSALRLVTEGYRYEDVIRYLRNPLFMTEDGSGSGFYHREMTDLLDNFLRARGIRGRKAFEEVWTDAYKDAEALNMQELNAFKEAALFPVFLLHDRLVAEKTSGERVNALLAFLDKVQIMEKTVLLSARYRALSCEREAEENERFLRLSLLLLERLQRFMGEETLRLKEFSELLDAGFSELKAGLIPQTMDMLLIGDLKRSRFDDIDVLYIVGANEGLIPSVVSGGGIFTDYEREELLSMRLSLAPPDRVDSCIQNFYLYLLMHKPRRKLIVSYANADRDGKGKKPSELLRTLSETYNGVKRFRAKEQGEIVSEADALLRLSRLLQEGKYEDAECKGLLRFLQSREETASKAEAMLKAAFFRYNSPALSEAVARSLYGDRIDGSVTRLESYERCAYAHFLRFGLKLKERKQFEVEAVDIGNLYHQAIDEIFRRLSESGTHLSEVPGELLSLYASEAVEKMTEQYNNRLLQSSARNRYIGERVKRITAKTLWALREQMRRSDFSVAGCEQQFRVQSEALDLNGRIDRVDTCKMQDTVYVKVLDYKSGRTEFDLSLVYQGLQIQLCAYMDAALERAAAGNQKAEPAGMMYYRIEDPIIAYSQGADAGEAALSALCPDGLLNGDEEILHRLDNSLSGTQNGASSVIPVKYKKGRLDERASRTADAEEIRGLLRHVRGRMQRDAEEIQGGDIDIHPYRNGDKTGCDYCPYHSVCGFDTRIKGFTYRNLRTMKDAEVWEALAAEEAKTKESKEPKEKSKE